MNMEATVAFQRQWQAPLRTFVPEHKLKDGKRTEEECLTMPGHEDGSAIPVPAIFMLVPGMPVVVNQSTLIAFRETEPGSKQFHLRLLELLAVSCHQIAVCLYNVTGRNHHHAEYDEWRDEPRDMSTWGSYRPPIAFTHGPYKAIEQYPHGLADVAAYWVEARIFGGIIVFDRGETEIEVDFPYILVEDITNPDIVASTSRMNGSWNGDLAHL
ncbi:hypothetical protein GGS23DRAFT_598272 [Durotheca rogersii]|uniref:uncharacterized protein n=1 Tax=Durotheca rogersii TaxID=419775 RepID=UPI00221E4179|nr:uncharacterized protein GGS23DRAFT_598272 [Durotheca rogersii]KAI5861491.1 hypothetical protein GGS23DRAFT_598272 [Durotheca rogersii]